jgi:predicted nuclease of predicted toxin-antitoxin system
MRFRIDENLHDDVATLLSGAGHDVHTVYDEGLRGSLDETIAERCRVEDRALVTLDLDFANIRTYPPASHPGMIVLRVAHQSRSHILQVMSSVVTLLASEQLANRLWIVSEAGVRIRG